MCDRNSISKVEGQQKTCSKYKPYGFAGCNAPTGRATGYTAATAAPLCGVAPELQGFRQRNPIVHEQCFAALKMPDCLRYALCTPGRCTVSFATHTPFVRSPPSIHVKYVCNHDSSHLLHVFTSPILSPVTSGDKRLAPCKHHLTSLW